MTGARRAASAALAAAAALTVAPAAARAGIDISVVPSEARYGQPHHAHGTLTDAAGAPLPGRRIALEQRDFPFKGAFQPIGHTTTGADGSFRFDDIQVPRNTDLRVVAFDGTTSGVARAWTYPAFTLTYRVAGRDRIVVTQTYSTPRNVRLRAPTLFFLGAPAAARSTLRVSAKTRRKVAGRFVATTAIRLPKAWKGRFRYASCFGYTPGSGMGDPARGCPARFTF